jgi:hypothetical protein
MVSSLADPAKREWLELIYKGLDQKLMAQGSINGRGCGVEGFSLPFSKNDQYYLQINVTSPGTIKFGAAHWVNEEGNPQQWCEVKTELTPPYRVDLYILRPDGQPFKIQVNFLQLLLPKSK